MVAQKFHAGRLTQESAIRCVSAHRFRERVKIIRSVREPTVERNEIVFHKR